MLWRAEAPDVCEHTLEPQTRGPRRVAKTWVPTLCATLGLQSKPTSWAHG